MPKLPRSDDFLVFLSSDPATLGLPLLKSDGICLDSLKFSQDLLSSFVRFAQIRLFLIRLGSDLHKSGDISLDPAPSTQIGEDRTSLPPAVAHHRTRPNQLFAPLSPTDSTRGGQ